MDVGELGVGVVRLDEDDPLTTADESGGPFYFPDVIYGSFLTGTNFPVTIQGDPALDDDIDGLTAWRDEIHPDPPWMVNAVSRKHHISGTPGGPGDAGNWDINLFPNYDVESRAAELQTVGSTSTTLLIEVRFDKTIGLLSLAGGDVITGC